MNTSDFYDNVDEEEFDYEKEAAKRLERAKKQQAKKQPRQREVSMPLLTEKSVCENSTTSVAQPAKISTSASQMHLQTLLSYYYDRSIVSKEIIQNAYNCVSCITVGNVDSGKSTIFGHLYYLLEGVHDRSAERNYAHFLDTSVEERDRNVTMSVNTYYLTINDKSFLMQDCPGHADYAHSIFTQVLRPDCGIIVIESFNFERTKEQIQLHLSYLMIFAVHQIVVLVNKMDKIDYGKKRFDEICTEMRKMIDEMQLNGKVDVSFVPCAGAVEEANNLVDYCSEMSFAQSTVRYSLYTLRKDKCKIKNKFPSAVIVDVIVENSEIQAHVFIDAGVLCIDDIVFAQPSMIYFRVAKIIEPSGVQMLIPGSRAFLILEPYLKPVQNLRVADSPKTACSSVRKGDSLELVGAMLQAQVYTLTSNKIRIQLLVTDEKGVCIGDVLESFIGIYQCEAKVATIDAICKGKEFLTTNQSFLTKGQLALVVLRFTYNIVCRKFEDSKIFGRVVLRNDQRIVGFGFIMGIKKSN